MTILEHTWFHLGEQRRAESLKRTHYRNFGWVLPIVYAYFTMSVISPLVLMSVADLQKAPPAPQPIAGSGGGAHDAGHH
jgi:hypothetical protein